MSDLEWYLDVGGKQSGPHSAKEIVELVRTGKIPATSQVTAARMGGDWVTAQDLIEAYDELYVKKPLEATIGKPSASPFTGVTDSNYTAPPRPTEQLERSKVFTINREELERTPDPTEALFHAIQAVREKANQKSTPSTTTPAGRDAFGQLSRPSRSGLPPQLLLILTLAAIFGVTVYGITKLVGGKKAEETAAKPPASAMKTTERAPIRPPSTTDGENGGGLLSDQGGGTSAARTAPPVQSRPMPRTPPTRVRPGQFPTRDDSPSKTGGARYRDDNEPEIEPDEEESEDQGLDKNLENPESIPVDPSQIPSDRIIPDPGMIPGRGSLPGTDPYQAPDPGGPQQ